MSVSRFEDDTSSTRIEPGKTGVAPTTGLAKGSLLAGVIAGLTASACCLGPLVLLTLGVSGSWIGNLSALEPYRPFFIGLTLLFLGLAFRRLYLKSASCALDSPCAEAGNLKRQKRLFWLASVVVAMVIAFPWYGPLILE